MPPSRGSNQQPAQPPPPTQKNSSSGRARGGRYVLSARAQAVLTWILEDIIEKTLEDARRQAEAAGKQRVELVEVEEALKRLCERYHARWAAETEAAKSRKSTSGRKRL